MTDIQQPAANLSASLRRKTGVRRMIKHNLKIDMTPMVDLGFLLISFFIFTAEMSRPKVMDLIMPKEGPPTPTAESKTITFLTGAANKLFYYFGEERDAGVKNPVIQTSWDEYKGVGKVIGDKQLQLDHVNGGRKEMLVIIKPGKESTYKNVVDLLDEMTIHLVTRFAVVKPGIADVHYLEMNK